MLRVFNENVAKLSSNATAYLSIGFHQETAQYYLDHLEDALPLIRKAARAAGVQLEFTVAPL